MGYNFGQKKVVARSSEYVRCRGHEIEYLYPSRSANESLEGVDDRHMKPIEPRQFRVSTLPTTRRPVGEPTSTSHKKPRRCARSTRDQAARDGQLPVGYADGRLDAVAQDKRQLPPALLLRDDRAARDPP